MGINLVCALPCTVTPTSRRQLLKEKSVKTPKEPRTSQPRSHYLKWSTHNLPLHFCASTWLAMEIISAIGHHWTRTCHEKHLLLLCCHFTPSKAKPKCLTQKRRFPHTYFLNKCRGFRRVTRITMCHSRDAKRMHTNHLGFFTTTNAAKIESKLTSLSSCSNNQKQLCLLDFASCTSRSVSLDHTQHPWTLPGRNLCGHVWAQFQGFKLAGLCFCAFPLTAKEWAPRYRNPIC